MNDLPTPAGYRHAATAAPGSRLVWTAGQLPLTSDGIAPHGWEAQVRQTMRNVTLALAAEGAQWSHVVKLTFFVTT